MATSRDSARIPTIKLVELPRRTREDAQALLAAIAPAGSAVLDFAETGIASVEFIDELFRNGQERYPGMTLLAINGTGQVDSLLWSIKTAREHREMLEAIYTPA